MFPKTKIFFSYDDLEKLFFFVSIFTYEYTVYKESVIFFYFLAIDFRIDVSTNEKSVHARQYTFYSCKIDFAYKSTYQPMKRVYTPDSKLLITLTIDFRLRIDVSTNEESLHSRQYTFLLAWQLIFAYESTYRPMKRVYTPDRTLCEEVDGKKDADIPLKYRLRKKNICAKGKIWNNKRQQKIMSFTFNQSNLITFN